MAGRPQETAGERKEVLESSRRVEPATAQVALGENRKDLHFRGARWQGEARRFVRGQKPTHRVSFHVWTRLERRLPALLVLGGPFRQREHSHWAAGHSVGRRFARGLE